MRAACCPHCRGDLAAAAQAPCEGYDHVEIPPIRPEVTRVTLMGGTCPHCARAFKAAPPADMPPGSPFGPNLRALALHLRFSQNIGFDRLQAVFRDVFGVGISQGGAGQPRARGRRRPFAAQAARLRERLLASPVLASDETGLRVGGQERLALGDAPRRQRGVPGRPEPGQAGARGLPRRAPARLLDLRPLRRAEGLRDAAATSSAWRI